jgi:hypothetical protein
LLLSIERLPGPAITEKEHIMSTTRNRKKLITSALGAAAAAVAVPTMLFVGAGTAHAANPGVRVNTAPDALGVDVTITAAVPFATSDYGWCTYQAFPVGSALLPTPPTPFRLEAGTPGNPQSATLFFPGIETGTNWQVAVDCPTQGGDQPILNGKTKTY